MEPQRIVDLDTHVGLEPEAATPMISAAVSLKRIADAFEKLLKKILEEEVNRG